MGEEKKADAELALEEKPDGSFEIRGVAAAGDDAAATGQEDADDAQKDTESEGERKAKREEPADGVALDEELRSAASDEEREAIRARRRQERQDRRARRRERDSELQAQLQSQSAQIEQLQSQLMMLSRKSAGTELASIDAELRQAGSAAQELKDLIAEASKNQQGDIVADATDRLVRVHQRANQLLNIRQAFVTNAQRETAAPPLPSPQLDVDTINHGRAWIQRNSWYDPKGQDMDSRITREIDNAIMAEGFNPSSPDYWDELSDRIARYLPHRAAGVAQSRETRHDDAAPGQRSVRRTPVAGSGRDSGAASGGTSKGGSYTLSPERVKALKDAGVWDDPRLRADAIQRYRTYDQQAAAERR